MPQTIHLHQLAPAKPAIGAPCNGCGVCCAAEPCPIGILISRKRQGRCTALQWDDVQTRYVCGMVAQPDAYLNVNCSWLNRLISRWARRWIAAGVGCDSDCSTEPNKDCI
ncbi:hypothetical protein K4H28_00290 [Deefgea tanakiae]|uniref:4Fe-4S ferredoxin-type domain-containing protein n=1 Tax=Deefgea tanakiae TaxID=2865840 RepID=A0ABX8Z5R5_9NEIS|nr:hypothetical protein [Deefgea tanakiae]QZA77917.1 hypothetical protein K4H28_00290 [Deefgea tanakiae]